jgi:tetratricopeptide (TPR) repeat protein
MYEGRLFIKHKRLNMEEGNSKNTNGKMEFSDIPVMKKPVLKKEIPGESKPSRPETGVSALEMENKDKEPSGSAGRENENIYDNPQTRKPRQKTVFLMAILLSFITFLFILIIAMFTFSTNMTSSKETSVKTRRKTEKNKIKSPKPRKVQPVKNKISAKKAPENLEAHKALEARGRFYFKSREWGKALKDFSTLLNEKKSVDIARLAAYSKAYSGDIDTAIKKYNDFLEKKKMGPSERALALIPLAQMRKTPEMSSDLLKILEKDSKFYNEYRCFYLRHKAIYSHISASDFSQWESEKTRLYRIIGLLAKGETKKVLLLPVPPSEFPDFWKTFIGWRENNKHWRRNAVKLYQKDIKGRGRVKSIAAGLWLGRVTPEKALKTLNSLNPEDDPVLYFVLAEYWRKAGNKTRQKEFYEKAVKLKGNPYRGVIIYYMNKK